MLEKNVARHLKQHKGNEEHDQRNVKLVALRIHVQILLQALNARVTEIDAVDKGQKVQRYEWRQEAPVTLARHSAGMIRVDDDGDAVRRGPGRDDGFLRCSSDGHAFFSVQHLCFSFAVEGYSVEIDDKDRGDKDGRDAHERLGRGQSAEGVWECTRGQEDEGGMDLLLRTVAFSFAKLALLVNSSRSCLRDTEELM